MIQLRPYQEEAIQLLREKYSAGIRKIVLVIPCGGGKTTIAGFLIKSFASKNKNILFLAHRTELIFQCWRRLSQLEIYANIIKSDINKWKVLALGEKMGISLRYGEILSNVITASIQTISRRMIDYIDNHFHLIIVDECHTSISDSYVIFLTQFKKAFIIGLTATPFRTNKKEGLNVLYEDYVNNITHQQLIDNHYLVPTKVFRSGKFNSKNLKVKMGEYTDDSVMKAFDESNAEFNLILNIKTHALGLKTLVFCQNIEHSIRTKDVLRLNGYTAEHVDANTPQAERDAMIQGFRDGTIQYLTNFNILSEGVDVPDCRCVILNICTKSRIKYHQASNRCTRVLTYIGNEHDDEKRRRLQLDSEKQFGVIIDMADNTFRFGFVEDEMEVSLEPQSSDDLGVAPVKECPGKTDDGPCGCLVHTTIMLCPECGHVFEKKEEKKPKEEEVFLEAQRKSLEAKEKEKILKPFLKLKSWEWNKIPVDLLKDFAKSKGYHHGWVKRQNELRTKNKKPIRLDGIVGSGGPVWGLKNELEDAYYNDGLIDATKFQFVSENEELMVFKYVGVLEE